MINFAEQYELWDKFIRRWPISDLEKMTLDEYIKAGSTDTFTYWIEARLDKMGSIWGGNAFKFGVYSRKDTKEIKSDARYRYSDAYGWNAKLGETAELAFKSVRDHVVNIATWAAEGDLDSIDTYEQPLWEFVKWKIAFHYQDRQQPKIVNIFKKSMLAVHLSESEKLSMGALQKATLAKMPAGMGILEYGYKVWEDWSQKNLGIWKLLHSESSMSADGQRLYRLENLAVLVRAGTEDQSNAFRNTPNGTLFFLCHGDYPVRIGQFTSDASPRTNENEGWQRRYRVFKEAVKTEPYTENRKKWMPGAESTFKRVGSEDLTLFEATLLKPYFETDLAELAVWAGEFNESECEEAAPAPVDNGAKINMNSKPIAPCFNRIYYGPPGTGKTYALMQLLEKNYKSESASITPEEWRNQFIADKIAGLKWWEGVAAALYDLSTMATVPNITKHPFIQAIVSSKNRTSSITQTLWGTLQSHTVESSTTVNAKKGMNPAIFDKSADSVWKLAGDWKDVCSDIIDLVDQFKAGPAADATVQRYSIVTFHQSYGYEEFVEGLRPVLNGDGETDNIAYEIRAGAFKELCHKARQTPGQRFAMVIDEINRGNISKIFGELITLIEPDKRDPLKGNVPPLELALAYSGEKFSVPANVDIIGTMNTADRSLALLDTALRRRFEFVPLLPDVRAVKDAGELNDPPLAGLIVKTSAGDIDVRQMLTRINERIEVLYDRDHCIGHAYFTLLKKEQNEDNLFDMLAGIFRNRIIPLLEEYFFEDWRKIRLVLGDNQKSDVNAQFIAESDAHQDLSSLFGNGHGLESYTTKRRYTVQTAAFANPQAYIGIYQPLA